MAGRKPVIDVPHEEVLRIKAKCNKIVDDNFNMSEHCDEHLASFLSPLVVASCQHPMPTLCLLAGGFGNVTNGAKINMWNTGATPLSTIQFFVGDAQQGKSRLSAYIAAIIDQTDKKLAKLVADFLDGLDLPRGADKPELTIRSTGVMDFTPAEFFVRATGDWNMVKEYPEMSQLLAELGPRPWKNLTANVDEAYPFMQNMGWMQESRGGNQGAACPSQNASKVNTLVNTGIFQRDTRASGNYGGSKVGAVNVQVLGNVHWLMLILLERGNFGGDVQQAKARAVYVAGEATKRHAELPGDFILPEGVPSKWTWLPLTARLATAFGLEKFYQKPRVAAEELGECDKAENEDAAKRGHQYLGPAGGYKVQLSDGVEVRIRFSRDEAGTMHTEYRISSRWKLPSPMKKLLEAVERVFDFFKDRQYHTIPFKEAAQHILLGCQLEQNLLGDACQKVGDSIGEAQHGQAAGQIGIYAGLLSILRWAATPAGVAPDDIIIEVKDVELAEIIIRVSLLLKKTLRQEEGAAGTSSAAGLYPAPANRAVSLDGVAGAFALPYSTQADGPTQINSEEVRAEDDLMAAAGDAPRIAAEFAPVDSASEVLGQDAQEAQVPLGAEAATDEVGLSGDRAAKVLQLSDLKAESDFFREGFGPDGAHLLKSTWGDFVIEDRRLMQKLFLTGKSSYPLKTVVDWKHKSKHCRKECVAELLKVFAEKFPRLAVFEGGVFHLRDFPEDHAAQDRMHNDCMQAVRVSLKVASEARVKWMMTSNPVAKRAREGEAATEPFVAGEAGAASQRRRAGICRAGL